MNDTCPSILVYGDFVQAMQNWMRSHDITHLDNDWNFIDAEGNIDELYPSQSWWDWMLQGTEEDNENNSMMTKIHEYADAWIFKVAQETDEADIASLPYPTESATPVNVLNHYTQMARDMQVQDFDYVNGDRNHDEYNGSTEPPAFPIASIDTVPMYIVSPSRDHLASVSDTQWLYDTLLPNYAETELVLASLTGGHNTPLNGSDMSYIADDIIPFMGRHTE